MMQIFNATGQLSPEYAPPFGYYERKQIFKKKKITLKLFIKKVHKWAFIFMREEIVLFF